MTALRAQRLIGQASLVRVLRLRWWRLVDAGQSGQAMVESSVLLATLLGSLAVGGGLLMRYHPALMNVLDTYMQGFYFTYSMPFP